jgi:YHS domain-containing protein
VQGPEIWLNQLGITVPCVVDPARDAVLDAAHRVFVNWESYYLCDAAALAAFRAAPWRYTGPVTDPVSRERFVPDGRSPSAAHGGRLFYFASDATARTFAADPAVHATPLVPYAGRM